MVTPGRNSRGRRTFATVMPRSLATKPRAARSSPASSRSVSTPSSESVAQAAAPAGPLPTTTTRAPYFIGRLPYLGARRSQPQKRRNLFGFDARARDAAAGLGYPIGFGERGGGAAGCRRRPRPARRVSLWKNRSRSARVGKSRRELPARPAPAVWQLGTDAQLDGCDSGERRERPACFPPGK